MEIKGVSGFVFKQRLALADVAQMSRNFLPPSLVAGSDFPLKQVKWINEKHFFKPTMNPLSQL